MKTVWIIDGAYLFNHGRTHPFDYLKLKSELVKLNDGPIYEAYYLNSTRDPASDAQNAFHTWLKSAPPRGPKIRVQLYRLKTCTSPVFTVERKAAARCRKAWMWGSPPSSSSWRPKVCMTA